MPQQSAFEYLAHGQTPFFRLPVAPGPIPAGTRAAVIGVPFDHGATYQPGARLAPFHVRRVSAFVQGFHPVHRVEVFDAVPAVDGGNVAFPPFSPEAMREAVEARAAAIAAAGAAPFTVGGDHSVTLPVLRALAKRHGPLAIVHVDAHLDTSGPEVWGEAFHHGTPFRHALEEGLVSPGGLFQLGIRGPWGAASDADPGARHGARVVPPDEVAAIGAGALGAELRKAIGDRPAYLSVDVDGLDPAFAPGTGTPVPGGLTSREALALLRALAGADVVGMDVVEVCPPLDHADATSHLAAHLLFEGLALVAVAGRR
ncbi:MAG TPA: agmatinase [Anaeromyxobacteraceae bacterium]|nr:agmatinase [Anaeromyxobacteraceae bacterium]